MTTVSLYSLNFGRGHLRMATQVVFPDGYTVRFEDRMGKRQAIRQAEYQRAKAEGQTSLTVAAWLAK
jgi:hypothetical protein